MNEIILLSNSKELYNTINKHCQCYHVDSLLETTEVVMSRDVHFLICDVDSYDFNLESYLEYIQRAAGIVVIIYTDSMENELLYQRNPHLRLYLHSSTLYDQLNDLEECLEHQIFNT